LPWVFSVWFMFYLRNGALQRAAVPAIFALHQPIMAAGIRVIGVQYRG